MRRGINKYSVIGFADSREGERSWAENEDSELGMGNKKREMKGNSVKGPLLT